MDESVKKSLRGTTEKEALPVYQIYNFYKTCLRILEHCLQQTLIGRDEEFASEERVAYLVYEPMESIDDE